MFEGCTCHVGERATVEGSQPCLPAQAASGLAAEDFKSSSITSKLGDQGA